MGHLPELIQDLALILIAAGIVTVLFRKIRQPVVLGYIVAGLAVGPHVPFLPTISEIESIRVWAEIGVIFLLFALGLEFSFKKLVRVGGAAGVTTLVEVAGMLLLGYLTGAVLGWKPMDSLFLGGILAISSTTIIIRAFDEIGVKTRGFVSLVFGVLIIEDLVAILLLVLLSTVAISQSFSGEELLGSVLKLAFFLTLWFLAGIFLLPTILKKIRSVLGRETLLIVSLGLCFMMVVLATEAGFSPALGAFIMGSILAETTEGETIEHLIQPVKDLFAAIFFVSVGMLIDPKTIVEHAWPVLLITVVTIVGKAASTGLGALLSGQSLRHSVQAGFSLAQIGEFSFIIASLGLTMKVTSDFLYPIAVSVSAITTFTTPYMIRWADPACAWLERRLPAPWQEQLVRYGVAARAASATSEWQLVLRAYGLRVLGNSVLVIFLFFAAARVLPPVLTRYVNPDWVAGLSLAVTTIVAAPFFWALAFGRRFDPSARQLWTHRSHRAILVVLDFGRIIFAIGLFGTLAARFIGLKLALVLTMLVSIAVLTMASRHLNAIYQWFERRFLENLTEKERHKAAEALPPLAPWDAHLARFEVPPESAAAGHTLEELKVRERFGVTIALIQRGQRHLAAPNRREKLFPRDQVAIIGTDEQIARFKSFLQESEPVDNQDLGTGSHHFALHTLKLEESSPYSLKTIRDSGIRERCHGLVVGIERGGQRILNPDSTLRLEPGDLLWIVADSNRIKDL